MNNAKKGSIIIILVLVGIALSLLIAKSYIDESNSATQQNSVDTSTFVLYSEIQSTDITDREVFLVSTTSIPVNCEVSLYSKNLRGPIFFSDRYEKGEPHTEHSVMAYDLDSSSEYDYQFRADFDGQTFISDVRTFTTLPN